MISIVEITCIDTHEVQFLFKQFLVLYMDAFPDPNEREEATQWYERLSGAKEKTNEPVFHIVLAVKKTSKKTGQQMVIGGVVFEYYQESSCGLLTYIVVNPHYRNIGIARMLVDHAREILHIDAKKAGRSLNAVFAETRDPNGESIQEGRMKPSVLMRILSELGAKWIDIPYVQPELAPGKQRLRNLLLLVFPKFTDGSSTLKSEIVHDFLREFYLVQGVSFLESDTDLKKMAEGLKDQHILLKELPVIEKPLLFFKRAAITLHAVSLSKDGWKTDPEEQLSCLNFRSFELDLMSYRFQGSPPFYSRCVTLKPVHVEIHFPTQVEYCTEGRVVPLISFDTKRAALSVLSYTHFKESNIRIWHLTLHPSEEEPFSEYDIIKLIKLYGGQQETNNLLNNIQFTYQKRMMPFIDLITAMAGCENLMVESPRAGTIELDFASCLSVPAKWDLLPKLQMMFRHDKDAATEIEDSFKQPNFDSNGQYIDRDKGKGKEDFDGRVLRVLCGIVTGIFDFGRMSIGEFLDTMEPTWIDDSGFIRIHRGTLTSFVVDDKILQACWNTIGISPYLIIPHAVLLHNEFLVDIAETRLKHALFEIGPSVRNNQRLLGEWKSAYREAELRLTLQYLPNIFQYSTEKCLMDEGLKHRGSIQKYEITKNMLSELTNRLKNIRETRAEQSEFVLSILLAFLSGLSTQPIIFALTQSWRDKFIGTSLPWIIFSVCMLAFIGVIFFSRRYKRKL